MRYFEIITEANRISPGLWTKVSPRDLQRFAATQHLRGFAAHDAVFVWNAYEETHYGMLGEIGIEENEGIPFFVRSKSPSKDGNRGGDDPPGDWEGGHEFSVGDVAVIVSGENAADVQTNRGFCYMVGLPVPKAPQRPRHRFAVEFRDWMKANGWDDTAVDAYQTWSGGYRPWDSPNTADDGRFSFADWQKLRAQPKVADS